MIVTLADPAVYIKGWQDKYDRLGAYSLKIRKSPEDIKEEKRLLRERYGETVATVSPVRLEYHNAIVHDSDEPDSVYFLPGLWPRIRQKLDADGVQYEIVDKRDPDIRPELDYSAFSGFEFRENQDVALALIAASDCGIIETTTGWGKSMIISMLCKMYPTLNILVTTASTQVVGTLYEYLCRTIPGQIGMNGGGKCILNGKRVIVSTLASLPKLSAEKFQLVLVDECHAIGDNLAGKELMKFCFARRFGFSASPVRGDGSGMMMEALLGPTILKMTYQEAVDANMVTPMRYLMLPCTGCPDIAKVDALPDTALKKWSYWCNSARNNAIRRFVYDLKNVYDGQILIMVGTLEHAIQLSLLLPWFKVAYYGATDMQDMQRKFPKSKYPNLDLSQYKSTKKDLDRIRGAFAKGTLRYVISTKVFKQGVNFTHLQVLIRADGDVSGVECIQVPGRLSRLDEDKDYAYLVDVEDKFSQWARSRALARERQYKEQEWKSIGYQELLDDLGTDTKKDCS